MSELVKPYIGVSGVVSREQELRLINAFEASGLSETRVLALGIKAVHNTQFIDRENKYGRDWYPVGEKEFTHPVNNMTDTTFGVAQIYLDPDYLDSKTYRDEFMNRIATRGRFWLEAFQFDMLPWHQDDTLFEFINSMKQRYDKKIILQCHENAMMTLGPDNLAAVLDEHAELLDYILLDTSHGKGRPLDPSYLRPFLDACYESLPLDRLGVGVAGGLDAKLILSELSELAAEFPDLSWDAEGKLHPARHDGTRPLDMQVAEEYFEASARVLGT